MEPELIGKETVGPEKEKPEPNNEEAKQTLEKNTPDFSSLSSSSSSSTSSGLSLEFGLEEKDDDLFDNDPKLDAPAGYDPDCIPKSVFAEKPSNPDDWSAASNESLFSINMGNNSFSHDHALLYEKSGELGRFDDWTNQGNAPNVDKANYANDPIISHGLPTVVEEGSVTSGGAYGAESFGSLSKVSDGPGSHRGKEDDRVGTGVKKGPLDGNRLNSFNNDARCSEESEKSDVSFAFPVLVGDGVKTESMRRDTDVTEKPHELQEQVSNKPSDHHRTNIPEGCWLSRFCCWPRSG